MISSQYQVLIVCFVTTTHVASGELQRSHTETYKSEKSEPSTTRSVIADVAAADMPDPNVADTAAVNAHGEPGTMSTFDVWLYSVLGAVVVGLSGIFPLLVIPLEAGPSLKHGGAAARLKLMLSFAVGSLLGDVFLHLLPEVWSFVNRDDHKSHIKVGVWIIGGLLFFLVIEKLFGDETEFDVLEDTCDESEGQESSATKVTWKNDSSEHSCTRKRQISQCGTHLNSNTVSSMQNGKSQRKYDTDRSIPPNMSNYSDSHIKVSGYLNLFANVVDNFTHGLAIAGSFLISFRVGVATTVAILLHEVPHEVGDFAILLRSGFDRWRAAKAQFFTATGGVVGAVTALMSESVQSAGERTVWVLPFTSGGFLYIALVTVVPDLLAERHMLESVKQIGCLILGILSMICVTVVFD